MTSIRWTDAEQRATRARMETTMAKETKVEVRIAPVPLSKFYDGQAVEVRATMRAEGHYRPVTGRDVFGNRRPPEWTADRWQAVHTVIDQGRPPGHPDRETRTVSPWLPSMSDAEAWLSSRGLIIGGGGYWRGATRA